MEFLKELFNDGALTFDQLSELVNAKGYQVVNAAGGAYVPKDQMDTLSGQLSEANKKLEGYDPTWKDKTEAARKDLEAQQFNFALEKAVAAAKPKNPRAVLPFLDRETLKLADGELVGVEKQLADLRKNADTAFLFQEDKPIKTGLSHQNNKEVGGGSRNYEVNAAIREALGREGYKKHPPLAERRFY